MPTISFGSSDYDNSQSESGVAHENTSNTNYSNAGTVVHGPPTSNRVGESSLIGHWLCQESTGASTVHDYSGQGNDATVKNTLTFENDAPVANTALYSDQNGHAVIGNQSEYQFTASDEFTISCWLKIQGFGFSGTWTSRRNIAAHRGGGSSFWQLRTDNGTIEFVVKGATNNVVSSWSGGSTGNWYNVTCTFNNGTAKMFIDGSEVDSSTQSLSSGVTSGDLALGQRADGGPSTQLEGYLCDTRIYDTALSASQISSLNDNVHNTASITSAANQPSSSVGSTADIVTDSTLPSGTSVDITLYEDIDNDGSAEYSTTVTLSGGSSETNSISGLNGGIGNDYWVKIDYSTSTITNAAEITSVDVNLAQGTIKIRPETEVIEFGTSDPKVPLITPQHENPAIFGENKFGFNRGVKTTESATLTISSQVNANDGILVIESATTSISLTQSLLEDSKWIEYGSVSTSTTPKVTDLALALESPSEDIQLQTSASELGLAVESPSTTDVVQINLDSDTALVNESGKVVGIISSTLVDSGLANESSSTTTGFNFTATGSSVAFENGSISEPFILQLAESAGEILVSESGQIVGIVSPDVSEIATSTESSSVNVVSDVHINDLSKASEALLTTTSPSIEALSEVGIAVESVNTLAISDLNITSVTNTAKIYESSTLNVNQNISASEKTLAFENSTTTFSIVFELTTEKDKVDHAVVIGSPEGDVIYIGPDDVHYS